MSRRKDEDFFVRCVRALKSIDCRDSRTKSGLEVGDGLCFDFFFSLVSPFWQVVTCGFVGFSTRLDPDRPPCWRAEYVRFAYDAGCHVTSTLYIGRLTEAREAHRAVPSIGVSIVRLAGLDGTHDQHDAGQTMDGYSGIPRPSGGPFLPSECRTMVVFTHYRASVTRR